MAEEPSSPIPACPPLPKDLVLPMASPRKPPLKPTIRAAARPAPVKLPDSPPNDASVSLEEILKTFNAPISEDQAWALIYQSARMFKAALLQDSDGGSGTGRVVDGDDISDVSGGGGKGQQGRRHRRRDIRLPVKTRHLNVRKDGSCFVTVGDEDKDICVASSQKKILLKLGIVVYTALDYNLPSNEDCPMSHELEELIEFMTAEDNDDEGIEHDSEEPVTDEDEAVVADHVDDDEADRDSTEEGKDDDQHRHHHYHHHHHHRLHHLHHHHYNGDDGGGTDGGRSKSHHETKELDHVLAFCSSRVSPSKPEDHYRAVCRALATETLELRTFLQRVCQGDAEVLRLKAQAETSGKELEKIHFSDWARFWMQVVDELRRGVRLKKINSSRVPIEYELTPYEILMEDIRSRKYNLRKVMVNGDIPPRVKKDAHAVILEFIRSRPPLRKASDRKLAPQPLKRVSCPREQLLDSIRKGRVLKPVHPKLKTRRVASMISIIFPTMPQPFHCINIFLPTTQIDSVKKSCDELGNSSSSNNSSNSHSTTNNQQAPSSAVAASSATTAASSAAPTGSGTGTGSSNSSRSSTAAKSFGAASMYANSPRNTLRLIPVDFSLFEDDDFIIETAPNGDSTMAGSSTGTNGGHPRANGGGRYATLATGTKRSSGTAGDSTNLINNENNQNNINTVLRRTTYDLATQCESRRASMRRHTIIGCNQNYKLDHLSSHSMPPSRPASRQSDHQTNAVQPSNQAQGTPQHQLTTATAATTTTMTATSNGCAAVVAGDLLVASNSNISSLDTWTKSSLDEHQWKDTFNLNDRLSLTLEEIVHIRSVMTKAELEGLPVDVHIKEDVEKRKVCFLCLRTRFTLFARGILCKLCQRTVCNKCNQKMRIPTEHFRNVPVVFLSPSLMNSPCTSNTPSPSHHAHGGSGPHSMVDESFPRSLMERLLRPELDRKTRNTVGSAPSSPKNQRSASSTPGSSLHTGECLSLPLANGAHHKGDHHQHHPSATTAPGTSQHLYGHASSSSQAAKSLSLMTRSMEGPHSLPPQSPARPHSNNSTLDRSTSRNRFAKAFTLSAAATAGQNSAIDPQKERLTGELMAVCNDCRSLVLEIIRSSRQTRSSAQNQALRNLTLDLSPVYKR